MTVLHESLLFAFGVWAHQDTAWTYSMAANDGMAFDSCCIDFPMESVIQKKEPPTSGTPYEIVSVSIYILFVPHPYLDELPMIVAYYRRMYARHLLYIWQTRTRYYGSGEVPFTEILIVVNLVRKGRTSSTILSIL